MQNVTGANGYTPLPKPGAKGPIYTSLTEMGVVLLTFVGSCDGIAINCYLSSITKRLALGVTATSIEPIVFLGFQWKILEVTESFSYSWCQSILLRAILIVNTQHAFDSVSSVLQWILL